MTGCISVIDISYKHALKTTTISAVVFQALFFFKMSPCVINEEKDENTIICLCFGGVSGTQWLIG